MSYSNQTLQEIREQYPEYGDLSDKELANKLYDKYGQGTKRKDLFQEIGYSPKMKLTETPSDIVALILALWVLLAAIRAIFLKSKGFYKKPENELSQHFSYRLIQVLYLATFVLGMAYILIMGGPAILSPNEWAFGVWFLAIGYFSLYAFLNLCREALLYLFLQ